MHWNKTATLQASVITHHFLFYFSEYDLVFRVLYRNSQQETTSTQMSPFNLSGRGIDRKPKASALEASTQACLVYD